MDPSAASAARFGFIMLGFAWIWRSLSILKLPRTTTSSPSSRPLKTT